MWSDHNMIVADVTIGYPVLLETLQRLPDIDVTWKMTHSGTQTEMLFWIKSDDFEAVEAALEIDETVANPTVLTTVGERRLYRVEFTNGDEIDIRSKLIEVGGIPREVVGNPRGWECQLRFPDREAVSKIQHFCQDHDIDFTLHRLFEETDVNGTDTYSVTQSQRDTLITAVDYGYLDIPHETTLSELGAHFDISDTAVSHRFRRGVKTLILNTIYPSQDG